MNFHRPQYSLVQEPWSTWAVWDNWHDEPACIDFKPLVGLPKDRAVLIMTILIQIGASSLPEDESLRRSIAKLC